MFFYCWVLFALILCSDSASARLENYSRFIVADSASAQSARDSLRVTYLGVSGYLEASGHALLVDPYLRARA